MTSFGGGGLFGQPSQFGATQGFAAAPQPGGGLFGSGTGLSQGFGGQQQQPQQLFGGAQIQGNQGFGNLGASTGGGFGNMTTPQPASGFGGFGQNMGQNAPLNQNQPTGGFGTFAQAATNVIGQSTGFSGFGGATSAFGGAPGGFGGATSGFGAQATSIFGQQQPTQNQNFGVGLTNSLTNTSSFGSNLTGQTSSYGQQQQQKSDVVGNGFYVNPMEQSVYSIQYRFQEKKEQDITTSKTASQILLFSNIRIDPKFNPVTCQMLRIQDIIAMKTGQPQISYEFTAQNQFKMNPNDYILLQKVTQQQQPQIGFGTNTAPGVGGGIFGQQQAQTPQFGAQPSAFGGQFGQQQQQQQKVGGFGQTSSFGNTVTPSLFGGTQGGGFNQPAAGQGGIFGAQIPAQNTSLFGGAKPAATTSLFGSTQNTGFGNQATQPTFGAGGGLFGSQTNQPLGGGQPTGGMFGQPTQPGGGGLFGSNQPAQNTALFGQNQPQQPVFNKQVAFGQPSTGTPSLFGQGQQQQNLGGGGGLFGAQPQQQQQPNQALFGQPQQQQQQPVGGLFGNQPAGGGLFAQQVTPGASTGGIFGQQYPTMALGLGGGQQYNQSLLAQANKPLGSSLFNSGAQQQPAFGQQQLQQPQQNAFGQTPNQQPSSSLFGGNISTPAFGAQQTQNTSLFGSQQPTSLGQSSNLGIFASSTQQPQNNSLFNMSAQQPQQQQQFGIQQQAAPQPGQIIDIYGVQSQDPYGSKQYLDQASIFENLDKELSDLKAQSNTIDPSLNPYYQNMKINEKEYLKNNYTIQMDTKSHYSEQIQNEIILEEERMRQKEELMMRYARKADQQQEKTRGTFSANSGLSKYSSYQDSEVVLAPPSYSLSEQRNFNYDNLNKFKIPEDRFKAEQTQSLPVLRQNTSMRSTQSESLLQPKIIKQKSQKLQDGEEEDGFGKDVLKITAILQEKDFEREHIIYIHKSRDVQDIYLKVQEWLEHEFNFDTERQQIKLLYRNQLIKKTLSLNDADIQYHTRMYVLIDDIEDSYTRREPSAEYQQSQSIDKIAPKEKPIPQKKQEVQKQEKVSQKMVPRPPKLGYKITPSFEELLEMTLEELKTVKNFTIENQFGKIYFPGQTDLTEVDIGDIVTISKRNAEVYDDKRHQKPAQGHKLNKRAIITLQDIRPKRNETIEMKVETLKKNIEANEGEHLSYDPQKFIWQFRVEHFTKYGDAEDEEEDAVEESQMEEEDQSYQARSDLEDYAKASAAPPQSFGQPMYSAFTPTRQEIRSNQLKQQFQSAQEVEEEQEEDMVQESVVESDRAPRSATSLLMNQFESQSQQSAQRRKFDEAVPIDKGEYIIIRQPNEALDSRRRKAEVVLNRIKEKDNLIKRTQLHDRKVPTNQTMDYFQGLGVKTFKKSSLVNNSVMRPQFRPDGSILTLKKSNNKLIIQKPSRPQNHLSQMNEAITQAVIKHAEIKPFEIGSARKLDQQLRNMNLGSQEDRKSKDVEMQDSSSQQTSSQIQEPRINQLNDIFFQDFFTNIRLPVMKFPTDPRDLFFLLRDIAEAYVLKLNTCEKSSHHDQLLLKQIREEFYIVCMLNALFGNPNIHLVQLHPKYRGYNNFNNALKTFGISSKDNSDAFTDGDKYEIGKKRKNAVSELIRFICQQENLLIEPRLIGASLDQVYTYASDLLLNGDFEEAVKHLNRHKKFKMAMYVSEIASSATARHYLKDQFTQNQQLYSNFNNSARQLVTFLTGDLDRSKLEWQRSLNYQLLVVSNPNYELREIIKEFDPSFQIQQQRPQQQKMQLGQQQKQQKQEPISVLYQLLKLYSQLEDQGERQKTIRSLWTFDNLQITPFTKVTDHRIKWLIQLVIKQFSSHTKLPINLSSYDARTREIGTRDDYFSQQCSLYANQLMVQGSYKQALLVSLFIPNTQQILKKQLIFNIMSRKALYFVSHSYCSQDFNYLYLKLKLPDRYIYAARALAYQYRFSYERAMFDWNITGHYDRVHHIFTQNILPLYFHLHHRLSEIVYLLNTNQKMIQEVLRPLQSKQAHIKNWDRYGQLICQFFKCFEKCIQGNAVPQDIKELCDILNAASTERLSTQILIWEEVLDWDKFMKLDRCKSEVTQDNIIGIAQSNLDSIEPSSSIIQNYILRSGRYLQCLDEFAVQGLAHMAYASQMA